MAYNFAKLKEKSKNLEEWLTKEFGGIRTGRANPNILDIVMVEVYGSKMPVKQLASITNEDARTIRVNPYDLTQAKAIEKAIVASNLGLSVGADEKGVRVSFPELTSERRVALIKLAKEKLEQAKISLRKLRDEEMDEIAKMEKNKAIGEDEKFRLKAELQKVIDAESKKIEEHFSKKEKEITS
jgi:ribosome recycling factor